MKRKLRVLKNTMLYQRINILNKVEQELWNKLSGINVRYNRDVLSSILKIQELRTILEILEEEGD